MSNFNRNSSLTWSVITVLFIVLIGINTYIARSTVTELNALQQSMRKTGDIMVALDELHINLLTAESGQRGFLLTQEPPYLQHYFQVKQQMEASLAKVRSLDSEIPGQTDLINETADLIEVKMQKLTETIEQTQQEDYASVNATIKSNIGMELYSQIRLLFNRLSENENAYRQDLSLTLQLATAESRTTFVLSLITSLLLVLGIFFLARMNINFQKQRQREIEEQNAALFFAVEERTQELSIYSDELKRSNRELEDFAFVASHDLQEPLRKIQTFGDRLHSKYGPELGEKGQDYLSRMLSAAKRMSKLIQDLLEFSRVTTRGRDFEQVDLNTLVEECLDDLSVKLEEKDAKVDMQTLPTIEADPLQMQQLFTNLLSNALKFSVPKRPVEIKIRARDIKQPEQINLPDLSDWIEISIQDNGIGFEQEHADKIFAPFQRLHSRNEYQGTGIGLSICRRIVERHNGEITAQSGENSGATFLIRLPCVNYLSQITESETEND